MGERARNLFTIYQNKWQSMETPQRRRLLLVVSGVVIALAVTMFFALRPNWVILRGNLDPTVAVTIQEALDAEGIGHRTSANFRTVEVRQRDHERALAIVISNNILSPSQGFMLEDIIDRIGMTTSEDVRNQMFNQSDEYQIARALVGFTGISHAVVNINPGDPNAILRTGANRPSASVVLTTYIDIDSNMALSLAYTVANAIPGLTTSNVNISDQNMRTLFNGAMIGDDRFGQGASPDPRAAHTLLMSTNVMNVLSSAFHGVYVSPSVVVSYADTTVQTVVYAAPEGSIGGFPSVRQVSSTFAEGLTGGPLFPAGADANVGQLIAGAEASEFMGETTDEFIEYLYNRTQTFTTYLPGALNREESTIAVMLYTNAIHNEAVLRQLGVLDDYESFDHYRIVHSANVIIPEDEIPNFEQLVGLVASASGLPVENVTLMFFERPLFFEELVVPVNWQTIVFFAVLTVFLLLLAFGLLRGRRTEEIEIEPEPELSVEDLLVSTRIEVDEEVETQKLQDLAYAVDSEVKQQIDKFVNEKPEAVAQLLRSWINEGWE